MGEGAGMAEGPLSICHLVFPQGLLAVTRQFLLLLCFAKLSPHCESLIAFF
jgi:hypothetical protein